MQEKWGVSPYHPMTRLPMSKIKALTIQDDNENAYVLEKRPNVWDFCKSLRRWGFRVLAYIVKIASTAKWSSYYKCNFDWGLNMRPQPPELNLCDVVSR